MTITKQTNVEATTPQETPMPSENDNDESHSGEFNPESGKNEKNESQSVALNSETGKNEENESKSSTFSPETGKNEKNEESQSGTFNPETGENEESQSGAFNPETGEINWDCPCLGGMAKGPCGEQFKAAFSCFIYSTADPKGVDCLEQFQEMKDCFRQHPDEYGEELDDDDSEEEEEEDMEVRQIDIVTEDAKKSTITVASTTEDSNTNDKQKSEN